MSDLRDSLLEQFRLVANGFAVELNTKYELEVFTAKVEGNPELIIAGQPGEEFVFEAVNIIFSRGTRQIHLREHNCLILQCTKVDSVAQFVAICEDLIRIMGGKTSMRPEDWWRSWEDLLGNSVVVPAVQGCWGELYFYLQSTKYQLGATWKSLSRGLVDFEAPSWNLEVKTSVVRTGKVITASSEMQFAGFGTTPLFLLYIRLIENMSAGVTLDQMLSELPSDRPRETSRREVDAYLRACGVLPGPFRRIPYSVETATVYPVDDTFPRITKESFVGGQVPVGINAFRYDIDLATLTSGVPLSEFLASIVELY